MTAYLIGCVLGFGIGYLSFRHCFAFCVSFFATFGLGVAVWGVIA